MLLVWPMQREWPGFQKAVSKVSGWERVHVLFSRHATQTAELVWSIAQLEVCVRACVCVCVCVCAFEQKM